MAYKVKGVLTNGKAFRFDAKSNLLHEAAVELTQKLQKIAPDAAVERVSFSSRKEDAPELVLSDVVKRERKPRANGDTPRKKGGTAKK